MNNSLNYKSSMRQHMHAFLREYEAKSYETRNFKWILHEFDTFLIDNGYDKDYITEPIFNKWCDHNMGLSSATRYTKARVIRAFAAFLSRIGIDSYIPRLGRLKRTDYIPYVFTPDEIDRIFRALDSLRLRIRLKRTILSSVPTIIRLLYSTGIRINEALYLLNKDVDFEKHAILLRNTKNNRQRYAPINPSLEAVLRQYISYRNQITRYDVANPENYFFISSLGKRCHKDEVALWFQQALKIAGIPYKGQYLGPRVHDLRHTCCCHSLVKQINAGKDLYVCLPVLSKFMGHTEIIATERYLRLTQNMYPEIIKMDQSVTEEINQLIKNSILLQNDEKYPE